MSKRKHRPRHDARQSIMPCDHCGDPFAREMDGGVFCHSVCRWEFLREQREGREHEIPTVTELIEAQESDSAA